MGSTGNRAPGHKDKNRNDSVVQDGRLNHVTGAPPAGGRYRFKVRGETVWMSWRA